MSGRAASALMAFSDAPPRTPKKVTGDITDGDKRIHAMRMPFNWNANGYSMQLYH